MCLPALPWPAGPACTGGPSTCSRPTTRPRWCSSPTTAGPRRPAGLARPDRAGRRAGDQARRLRDRGDAAAPDPGPARRGHRPALPGRADARQDRQLRRRLRRDRPGAGIDAGRSAAADAIRGEIRLWLGLLMVNLAATPPASASSPTPPTKLADAARQGGDGDGRAGPNERDGAAAHSWDWIGRARDRPDGCRRREPDRSPAHPAHRCSPGTATPLSGRSPDGLPRRDAAGEVLRHASTACSPPPSWRSTSGTTGAPRPAARGRGPGRPRGFGAHRVPLRSRSCAWTGWPGAGPTWRRLRGAVHAPPRHEQAEVDRLLFQGHWPSPRARRSRALERDRGAAARRRHGGWTWHQGIAAAPRLVRLAQHDPRAAWAIAEPAVSTLRGPGSWARTFGLSRSRSRPRWRCGHHTAAERLVAEAESDCRDRDAPAARPNWRWPGALLLRATEPTATPRVAAETSAEPQRRWQEIGRSYEVAKAAEHLGDALTYGDREDGGRHLTEALPATPTSARPRRRALPTHACVTSAVTPAGRGRRGYGERAVPPGSGRSPSCSSGGATNQDIAESLFLSPRTVEKHVARVLTKLGTERKSIQGGPVDLRRSRIRRTCLSKAPNTTDDAGGTERHVIALHRKPSSSRKGGANCFTHNPMRWRDGGRPGDQRS